MPACTWCGINDCIECKAKDHYSKGSQVIVVNYHREQHLGVKEKIYFQGFLYIHHSDMIKKELKKQEANRNEMERSDV